MRAIDIHCHPSTAEHTAAMGNFLAAFETLVGRKLEAKSEEAMANDFRRDDVLAMMIASDAQASTGGGFISNDWVAGLSDRHPDVFLPGWAVVDPWRGKAAVNELERAFTTLGLTGAKWQPILQAFYPHDRRFYPIWDLCQSLGAPVLIHAGTTAIGSGMQGGGGMKLDHARPLPNIDNIAADFPRLTIVMAHPAWPWTEEAIAVLLHKANVFMDISGWRPKYLPAPLKHELSRRLQDKILYGSDYPGWSPGQFLDELEMEGFKPPVIEKLFHKNAMRVLKLEAKVATALAAQKAREGRA
ncbi:MAG TPA: amidohydrolase family protein [Stellaceae bacterium]|nr:amidohydrolase family protein [Stellaceae bacterium]